MRCPDCNHRMRWLGSKFYCTLCDLQDLVNDRDDGGDEE